MSDPRVMIHGQRIHWDEEWNFSFWRPLNWHAYAVEGQHGIAYYPEQDPRTGFYVLARDLGEELGEPVTEADLPALREGLLEGLKNLPQCEVLSSKEIGKESAIGFEFTLTFAMDDEVYKRRLRLLYKGRHEFTIYGQGVPAKEFDLFENVFDWMYLTFTFGDLREKLDAMHPDIPGALDSPI